MQSSPSPLRPLLLGLLVALSAACGGGSTPPGDSPDAGPGDAGAQVIPLPEEPPPTRTVLTVEDQLRELGVNVSGIQGAGRKLDEAVTVGDEFAPLGMRARLAPMELLLAGAGDTCTDLDSSTPDDPGSRVLAIEVYDESVAAANKVKPQAECQRYETPGTTWVKGSDPDSSRAQPGSQATRAIVTGDFDGDGLDEGGSIYFRETIWNGSPTWALFSYRIEHGNRSLYQQLVSSRPVGTLPVRDAAAVAGDFNGDGSDDVVVGYLKDSYFSLVPFPQASPDAFDERAGGGQNQVSLQAPTGTRSITMAAGNLDADPQLELVVLLRNLVPGTGGGEPSGEVRYWIYDHLPADSFVFPLLETGTLTYTDPDSGTERNWLTANAVIGDFDGDGLGELAFTGVGRFPQGELTGNYTYVYRVRDDRAHGGGEMATRTLKASSPANPSANGDPGIIYEVFAVALDYDGDYTRELLANEHLLELTPRDTVGWDLVTVQTLSDIIPEGMSRHVSEATFALAGADVNNDGRHDVLSYSSYDSVLHMQGMGGFSTELGFNAQGAYPQLQPFDTDVDGSTVSYVKGSHRVELTEPVIHAVLAAPPYDPDYGQDPMDASSSYGKSTSTGTSRETTLSFSVSAAFGLKVGTSVGPLEFSVEAKTQLDTWVDKTSGTAYTTTVTDTYETYGRDAVVFTSFPYDVYDYAIVSSDVPALLGQTMSIMLPRSPVTRIVSRTYFNARVPDGGLRIDERVLKHAPGDVGSYMSLLEKNQLKERVLAGSFGAPVFLESARKTVGEGSTSTSTEIELSQESFYTQAVGASRSYSVALTGGVAVAEFSVGSGEENSVTISAGQSTILSSTVPSITVDDTQHPDAVYDWGMFTYMQRLSPTGTGAGQVFQVVNFWAE
ncbi:MAG: hypothetical protein L0Y66_09095 [Myxococcaceae bacterium]|nr:hypothetical protein [Myxococcaceae bacterium]MCI0669901.1 hypothetical protein [Myxococcaceae bacterium]